MTRCGKLSFVLLRRRSRESRKGWQEAKMTISNLVASVALKEAEVVNPSPTYARKLPLLALPYLFTMASRITFSTTAVQAEYEQNTCLLIPVITCFRTACCGAKLLRRIGLQPTRSTLYSEPGPDFHGRVR